MPKIVDHDARRAELVEASWKVIAAEGLEGLTMRKVADAAGCTTGRITHYFADREALVLAALRAVNDAARTRTAAILNTTSDAKDRLIHCLEEGLPLDTPRLQEWKVWIAFWSAAANHPDLAREDNARHRAWVRAMAPLIADVAPHSDPQYEARILMGIVDGLGLHAAINPTASNRAYTQTAVRSYVRALLAKEG